jgi:hypothetical protein
MDQANPVEITLLFLKILDFLRKKDHTHKVDEKEDLNNKKKGPWRLNIDISIYR